MAYKKSYTCYISITFSNNTNSVHINNNPSVYRNHRILNRSPVIYCKRRFPSRYLFICRNRHVQSIYPFLTVTDSLQVECRFGWKDDQPLVETVIHHNKENMQSLDIRIINDFNIKYSAKGYQIELIKNDSSHCKQYIKVGCTDSSERRFFSYDNNYGIPKITENCDCPFMNQCQTINTK